MADGQQVVEGRLQQPRGDRLWLALCTATGVAVDVTLNKYSSALPGWAVACIWIIPAILFIIWFWRVENTSNWVRLRFLEHPVSYILMFLILIPFSWQATATMVAKLQSSPKTQKTTNDPGVTTIPCPQSPAQPSPNLSPPAGSAPPIVTTDSKSTQAKTKTNPTPTVPPRLQNAPPSTYQQKCEGSACAQGPGSQATYNQYGAQKLVMTDSQCDAIRDAMKPYVGKTADIEADDVTDDSQTYAIKFAQCMRDAGMDVTGPVFNGTIATGSPRVSGIQAFIGKNRSDEENTLSALSTTLSPTQLSVVPGRDPNQIVILIRPNR